MRAFAITLLAWSCAAAAAAQTAATWPSKPVRLVVPYAPGGHVPFKGAAPASVALMSGEIDFMFSSTAAVVGPARSGKLRAVAVTGHKRVRELPDTPTVAESGLPGYTAIGIHGLLAPAGAAPELVRRIHAETIRALGTPETIEKIAQGGGSEYVGSTPEEFSAFVRSEISKWTKLVKASNIRVE